VGAELPHNYDHDHLHHDHNSSHYHDDSAHHDHELVNDYNDLGNVDDHDDHRYALASPFRVFTPSELGASAKVPVL